MLLGVMDDSRVGTERVLGAPGTSCCAWKIRIYTRSSESIIKRYKGK